MKKNIDTYSIYPLVVPAGQKSTISVFSKMSCNGNEPWANPRDKVKIGGAFSSNKQYSIKVFPREINVPETEAQQDIQYTIQNGYIFFDYTFYEEQEYMIFIYEMHDDISTQLTFFKVYSLFEDLYRRLPWKGEMHMHSNWSDGRQPPEIMYAYARRAGMEFAALTDHYIFQPAPPVRDIISDIDTGMKIYNGEEVHNRRQKMHIVSFGANRCISKMLEERYDEIKEEAIKIAEEHNPLPYDVDPVEYGVQRWVFDQIQKNGGIAILAHPYWPHETNSVYIPTSLSRLIIEEGFADAWEITGVDDGDKDFMQGILYSEERNKGYTMPVVGSTDAHDKAGLGDGFSIIFAEENSYTSLAQAIKNNMCVGVRQYKRVDGSMRHMAFGPSRLVRYAMFLMNEFYSVQNRLCYLEGELMVEAFTGNDWAKELIGKVAKQIEKEKNLCFGREPVSSILPRP